MAKKNDAGYYAVIPASVRYSEELPANAKLLYGELTALCGRDGYCWATNDYFAALYGVTPGTITRWVSALDKMGLIRYEMVATDKGSERRIYAGLFVVTEGGVRKNDEGGVRKNDDTPLSKNDGRGISKNDDTPLSKNDGRGISKNDDTPKGNIFNINNNTVNNTPHSPPKGGACAGAKRTRYEHKDTADWKPERFEKFWKYYRSISPGVNSNRQATIRAWDKLKPDDELIARMGAALEAMRMTDSWRRGIGIPYASTWLNNARWEDVEPGADGGGEGSYHDEAPVLTAEDSPYQRWSREWEREHGEG